MKLLKKAFFTLLAIHLFLWLVNLIPLGFNLEFEGKYFFYIELVLGGIILVNETYNFARVNPDFHKQFWQKSRKFLKRKKKEVEEWWEDDGLIEFIKRTGLPLFLNRPVVKYGLIPLFLLFFAIGHSFYVTLNSDIALSVLTIEESKDAILNYTTDPLRTGIVIKGMFTASENNLGMMSFRLKNDQKFLDQVLFRIRPEKWNNGWYSEKENRLSHSDEEGYLFFGFPLINNSQDQNYIFQIELTKNTNSSDAISSNEELKLEFSENKAVRSHYRLFFDGLNGSCNSLMSFFIKKIFFVFDKNEIISKCLSAFILLVYYLFFIFSQEKYWKKITCSRDLLILILALFLYIKIYFKIIDILSTFFLVKFI